MGNPGRHGTNLRRGSSTSSRARAARTVGRSRTASGKSKKARPADRGRCQARPQPWPRPSHANANASQGLLRDHHAARARYGPPLAHVAESLPDGSASVGLPDLRDAHRSDASRRVTLSSATAKKGIFGHGWFIGVLSRSLIN